MPLLRPEKCTNSRGGLTARRRLDSLPHRILRPLLLRPLRPKLFRVRIAPRGGRQRRARLRKDIPKPDYKWAAERKARYGLFAPGNIMVPVPPFTCLVCGGGAAALFLAACASFWASMAFFSSSSEIASANLTVP